MKITKGNKIKETVWIKTLGNKALTETFCGQIMFGTQKIGGSLFKGTFKGFFLAKNPLYGETP